MRLGGNVIRFRRSRFRALPPRRAAPVEGVTEKLASRSEDHEVRPRLERKGRERIRRPSR